MKKLKRSLCAGLCLLLLLSTGPSVAAIDQIWSLVVREYTKVYSATYEIVVDSWDYTQYEAGLDGKVRPLEPVTVQATKPYTVGPRDTTIYQLADGSYWLQQLYQHGVVPPSENNHNYTLVGFQAEYLIHTLLVDGIHGYMYNSGLGRSSEFTVQDGDEELKIPSVLITSSDITTGTYGNPFQVGTMPAEIQFTMSATDSIPSSYNAIPGSLPFILNDFSFVFRGVIKYTNIKEIKPVETIFGTRFEATPWNWFWFVVLFGWLWMWFI